MASDTHPLNSFQGDGLTNREHPATTRLYSEAIIEAIREPLVVLTGDLRIKRANPSFHKHFATNEQDTEGKLIFDLISGDDNDRETLRTHLLKVVTDKVTLEDIELKVTFPNLGERVMLLNVGPIVIENFDEQLLLLAIEDITEVRSANTQLLQSNRALLENNDALSTFSYVVSHDLQEPLRKIHTFSKLILEDDNNSLSEETRTYLDRIMVSIRRSQQLIDDLLNYSHISNSEEEMRQTNLGALLEEVLGEMAVFIEAKNGEVTVANLPVLRTIPVMMQQLFTNLISNALKYSKADSNPLIAISGREATPEEVAAFSNNGTQYYKIMVSDNGIGFEQEDADRIFEPFQRLHAKDKYEGSGIGLAICKKIIMKHKGFINAESSPGNGTTFNLYLPV